MRTKKQIIKILQNLKYYNLFPISQKAASYSVNSKSSNQFERLKRESFEINALQTAARYLTCYDSLDILENPKQELTKAAFVHNIVNGEADEWGLTKWGVKMKEKDLMMYVDLAIELYGKPVETKTN